MNLWTRLGLIVLTAVLMFSVSQLFAYYEDQTKSAALSERIQAVKQTTAVQIHSHEQSLASGKEPATPQAQRPIMEQFRLLLDENQDTVGWITVPDTPIDYPVVQTTDNSYYLDHDFDKNRSKSGTIFMDFRNDPHGGSRNTILYGHHMRDGSMFKGLLKYDDQKFFEKHRVITYTTLYETIQWEIFSVYVTDTTFNYIQPDFHSKRDYRDFLKAIQSKSKFKTNIELTDEDQILTLSTCAYDFEDARFVVHAKRKSGV